MTPGCTPSTMRGTSESCRRKGRRHAGRGGDQSHRRGVGRTSRRRRRPRPCRMPSTWPASRARPSALRLAEGLKKAGAEAAVITLADSVCWLLNIRGRDVPHTPFALAFAILHDDGGADLFLDPAKRTAELMAHLGNAVRIADPGQFTAALDAMKGRSVLVDPSTAASAIFDRLAKAGARIRQRRRSLPAAQGLQEQPGNRRHAQGAYPRRRGAGALSLLVRKRCRKRRADRNRRWRRRWKVIAAPPAA